mgnify:CR=1 FL=1
MIGGLMIADFRFDPAPSVDDVVVELLWHGEERMGQIVVPPGMDEAIVISGLPDLKPLPVISAVAYAMVLAAQSHRHLKLSGDPSAWRREWGSLIKSH